jgi:hypothetical protein
MLSFYICPFCFIVLFFVVFSQNTVIPSYCVFTSMKCYVDIYLGPVLKSVVYAG